MKSRLGRVSVSLSALVLIFAASACASETTTVSDQYAEGAPELGALELKITNEPTTEGVASSDDAVDASAMTADELANAAEASITDAASELGQARMAVRDLNQSLRNFLKPVVALIRDTEPTRTVGKVRIWGPVTRGATEYRLLLRASEGRRYSWRLDARAAGEVRSFTRVAAGEITLGSQARRGRGTAGFDLDTLGSLDPQVQARGQLLVGFAHGKLGTKARYALHNFTRDPAQADGIDGLVQQIHLKSGFSRLRLAYRGDLNGSPTPAQELILARVRHMAGRGGRSDLLAIGGDVPAGTAWVVSQCWNADLKQGYRVLRSCPRDGLFLTGCTVIDTQGDPASCLNDLHDPELPPVDPSAPLVDPEDATTGEVVDPPTAIPEVEGPTNE